MQHCGSGIVALFFYFLFTFERNIVLSLITLYLYISTSFLIETIIRNAPKGGKSNRQSYHPYGFRNLYKSTNEEYLRKFMKSIL
jgi:hypothetical protein